MQPNACPHMRYGTVITFPTALTLSHRHSSEFNSPYTLFPQFWCQRSSFFYVLGSERLRRSTYPQTGISLRGSADTPRHALCVILRARRYLFLQLNFRRLPRPHFPPSLPEYCDDKYSRLCIEGKGRSVFNTRYFLLLKCGKKETLRVRPHSRLLKQGCGLRVCFTSSAFTKNTSLICGDYNERILITTD